MPLVVTVNTVAECLRRDCNILGDNKNNYITQLPAKAFDSLQPSITPQKTLTIYRVRVLNIATNVKELCAELRKIALWESKTHEI